jgi:hypothetical protein
MRPLGTHLARLGCILVVGSLASGTATLGACSSSNCSNSATSFQVFQTGSPTSAIPVCTDSTNGESPPPYYQYGSHPPLELGDAGGYPFPGTPHLGKKALAQCAAICAGSGQFAIPCCQSQWIPETILCSPPCTP